MRDWVILSATLAPLAYLYVTGRLTMKWLFNLLKNNGSDSPPGVIDISDVWDAVQVMLIGAAIAAVTAAATHVQEAASNYTGAAALIAGGVVLFLKLVANWLSNNKKDV